ncbi:hypothetical protein Drorol1_Dr00026029 [Drosera rotundifolia]
MAKSSSQILVTAPEILFSSREESYAVEEMRFCSGGDANSQRQRWRRCSATVARIYYYIIFLNNEYRQKLDKSLLAHNLVDEDALRTLVKDQILCSREGGQEGSVEKLVQKRTTELSNLLGMLRSGSEKYVRSPRQPYASWKVKQDSEKFRSMYREGASGTPVHTFFVDGYVDALLDSCKYEVVHLIFSS